MEFKKNEEDERDNRSVKNQDARVILGSLYNLFPVRKSIRMGKLYFTDLVCNKLHICSERSIRRWAADINAHSYTPNKHTTRDTQQMLTSSEIECICGWVLYKNEGKILVNFKDIQKRIVEMFDMHVSIQTVKNYCKKVGLSTKAIQTRSSDSMIPEIDVAIEYLDFLEELNDDRVRTDFKEKLVAFDFTYNSHVHERIFGIGPTGGPSPKSVRSKSKYTNAYAIALLSSGVCFKPIIFTFDPVFDLEKLDQSTGKLNKEIFKERYGIDEWQIFYENGKGKCFFRETQRASKIAFERWKNVYPNIEDLVFLSDGGSAEIEDHRPIFLNCGVRKHYVFPASCHHYLSPLDNGANQMVKTTWKTSKDHSDEPANSFLLMNLYSNLKPETIRHLFDRNLLLSTAEPSIDDVELQVKNGSYKRMEFHEHCKNVYIDFLENALNECELIQHSTRDNRIRELNIKWPEAPMVDCGYVVTRSRDSSSNLTS